MDLLKRPYRIQAAGSGGISAECLARAEGVSCRGLVASTPGLCKIRHCSAYGGARGRNGVAGDATMAGQRRRRPGPGGPSRSIASRAGARVGIVGYMDPGRDKEVIVQSEPLINMAGVDGRARAARWDRGEQWQRRLVGRVAAGRVRADIRNRE